MCDGGCSLIPMLVPFSVAQRTPAWYLTCVKDLLNVAHWGSEQQGDHVRKHTRLPPCHFSTLQAPKSLVGAWERGVYDSRPR